MRLARVCLQNWRCFSMVNVPLGSLTIIAGPCGSGKTSFLDALCFLKDLASGVSLREAVNQRGGFSRLRNLEARFPDTDVVVEAHVREKKENTWVYRLKFGEPGGRLTIKEETIWQSSSLILRRPDSADHTNVRRREESALSPLLETAPVQRLACFFRSFRLENPLPHLWWQPASSPGTNAEPASTGNDFWERIAQTPERVRRIRFLHIARGLQTILPAVGGLKTEMDDLGRWHLRIAFRQWRPQATWLEDRQIPEGFRRLIPILWSVMQLAAPLFIEEPELGLHPEAIAKLPRILKQLARLSHRPPQLILTTHQPALFQDRLIRKEALILLVPDRRGTRVARGVPKEFVARFLEAGAVISEEIKPWLVSPEEPWLPLQTESWGKKKPPPKN